MKTWSRAAAVTTLAGALVAAGTPAPATDHRPPKTRLVVGAKEQRGRLGTYCWTTVSPPGYVRGCADAIYSWPQAKRVGAGREAVVRFPKAAPPSELSISRWRRVGRDGYPRGRAREVDFILRPAASGGEVAWEAAFTLPSKPGHLYLAVFGVWTDEEGSFDRQDASWTFHLRLRPGRS